MPWGIGSGGGSGGGSQTNDIIVSNSYEPIQDEVVQAGDILTIALGKLQGQINELGLETHYQGTYNATTNTPTLTNGVGTAGDFYYVIVGGSNNPTGVNINAGHIIIYNGTIWEDGGAVSSTDTVVVANDYVSVPNETVAIGQTTTYALGALQGQATKNATDIAGLTTDKQNLITTPTNNNIATTDATGQTKDSGVAISAVVTNPMTTLGDLIIGGASGAPTRLAGNTTTTPKYLKSINGTAATLTQIDYADIAGTPAVGSVVYNPLTTYVQTDFVTYNGYIWVCISPIPIIGQTPSTSSAVWRQASNFNFSKYAQVTLLQGNDTAGNGSVPFYTIQAALNYVVSYGWVDIVDYRQYYPEDIIVTNVTMFLTANSATIQGGAIVKSLTLGSGSGLFSSANIEYSNSVDAPALTVDTAGSTGYGYFNNCRFNVTAAGATAPCVLVTGAWVGDLYFNNCTFGNKNIVIEGTPPAQYKVYFNNCTGYNNVLNLTLTANVDVYLYNCDLVNIVSYTDGAIFMDGVRYLSGLSNGTAAAAGRKLSISNTSMRNPANGVYATPTGTGTVACEFLNFDYNRGAYSFAGTVIDSDNGFNAINRLAWISGYRYILGDMVTNNSALWRCVKPTGVTTQTPAVGATDWELISAYNQNKIVYLDTTLTANYNNVYTTLQAASNAAGEDGTVIILNPNGSTIESVTVTHNHQSWLAVGSVQGGANFTLLGTFDNTPLILDNVEGFKCEGIEISSDGTAYALSMNNVSNGIFFDKCNINYNTTADLMVIGGAWDGLIQFNNCKIDGFINSTLGTDPATSQIILNNCRPGDSNDLIIGLDGASLATLYAFDCPTLRVFQNSGKVYLANIPLIGDSLFEAVAAAGNLLSINTCSFYNPTTQTYSTISGTGNCATILQNVNYNRNTYTFAGLIPDGDTIAGIPVTSLSATAIFANMQGFTGAALSPAGYFNLNNGTTTFSNITVGTTAVTFLAQARIYKVTAVIELISNNPGGSASSATITPTVAGGSITINMLPQSISDSSNGVTHTLIFNGTINVSNLASTTTFSLVLTSLTGGYSFGTTNSLVIEGIN